MAATVPLFSYAQTSCPALSLGSSGSGVTALQLFFVSAYTNFPQTDVTGYFGPITQSAVKEWQSDHGIVSSGTPATTGWGVIGPKTRAAMGLSCAASVTTAVPTTQLSANQSLLQVLFAQLKVLQQKLAALNAPTPTQPVSVPITSSGGSPGGQPFIPVQTPTPTPTPTPIPSPTPTPTPTPTSTPSSASCTFNGQTIQSGSSVTAYQASSVPSGQSCTSQTRTCSNGMLSGTYTNASCSVSAPPPSASTPCSDGTYDCLQIRVGRPLVTRQTGNDELDGPVPQVKLPDGTWRAFTSEFNVWAINGGYPWQLSGARTKVLGPSGQIQGWNMCGRWLTSVVPDPANSRLIGFVHEESLPNCNATGGAAYDPYQTMAITFSTDNGLTWSNPWDPGSQTATIISSNTPAPYTSDPQNASGCQALKGLSNDLYLYCGDSPNNEIVLAHASLSDLSPAAWKRYYNGSFSQPGTGGNQDGVVAQNSTLSDPVYFKQLGLVGLLGWTNVSSNPIPGSALTDSILGMQLSFSNDFIHFKPSAINLLDLDYPSDGSSWTRPSPYALITYVGPFVNYSDGTNWVDNTGFALQYVYMAPGADVTAKDLVMQGVTITVLPSAPIAQVGDQLSRWVLPSGRYRSTTAPVPNATTDIDKNLGYVLTAPVTGYPTYKLEECKSNWTDEYLTTTEGAGNDCDPSAYNFYLTVGWSFQTQQPGTVSIYRCWGGYTTGHFVSNQADCEGKGTMELLLGYIFTQ